MDEQGREYLIWLVDYKLQWWCRSTIMTLPPQGYYSGGDDDDNNTTESLLQRNGVDDYDDEDVDSDPKLQSIPKLQIENTITLAGMRTEARLILGFAIPLSVTRLSVGITRAMSVFFIGRLTSAESLAGAALASSVARVTGFTLVKRKKYVLIKKKNVFHSKLIVSQMILNYVSDDFFRTRAEHNGRPSVWYV